MVTKIEVTRFDPDYERECMEPTENGEYVCASDYAFIKGVLEQHTPSAIGKHQRDKWPEYRIRVLDESVGIAFKISKLREFMGANGEKADVFSALAPWEKRLLHDQLSAMERYANILDQRLCNWNWLDWQAAK